MAGNETNDKFRIGVRVGTGAAAIAGGIVTGRATVAEKKFRRTAQEIDRQIRAAEETGQLWANFDALQKGTMSFLIPGDVAPEIYEKLFPAVEINQRLEEANEGAISSALTLIQFRTPRGGDQSGLSAVEKMLKAGIWSWKIPLVTPQALMRSVMASHFLFEIITGVSVGDIQFLHTGTILDSLAYQRQKSLAAEIEQKSPAYAEAATQADAKYTLRNLGGIATILLTFDLGTQIFCNGRHSWQVLATDQTCK